MVFAYLFSYALIVFMADVLKEKYTNTELLELNLDIDYQTCIKNIKDESCDDFLKIFSIVNLDTIHNQDDAESLIECLTNHSTPLREACALKIEELINNDSKYFLSEFSQNKILNAIIDINPNVSRAICNVLKTNLELSNSLEESIILNIENLLNDIKEYEKEFGDYFDNKIKNTKNHAKNKKLFSLYWYLEALAICLTKRHEKRVLKILENTINFLDFTIREKTTLVALKLGDTAKEILQKAKQDQNFYVKNLVYDKIIHED